MATTPSTSIAARAADDDARLPYGLLLARLGQESVARFRKALKPLGLNTQQFFVLRQLQAIGAASQASLADALGIDYSNLATITAELNDRGLIERYRHESDRRRYVVELSESGAALCGEASNAVAEGEDALLSTLEESAASGSGRCSARSPMPLPSVLATRRRRIGSATRSTPRRTGRATRISRSRRPEAPPAIPSPLVPAP